MYITKVLYTELLQEDFNTVLSHQVNFSRPANQVMVDKMGEIKNLQYYTGSATAILHFLHLLVTGL